MTAVYQSLGSYQGYPIQRVMHRRSEGFTAEPGWVDVAIEDCKKIMVLPREVPWRSRFFEEAGGLSIRSWFKRRSETRTELPALPAPEGGGFNAFGDLILTSFADDVALAPLIYADVYIADERIEEIEDDLADRRAHVEGLVRVPLTDIRHFWRDHGYIAQSINVRRRSGKYHPETIQKPDPNATEGKPWPLEFVVEYILSQLPGSPVLHGASRVHLKKLDPPDDVRADGQLAVQVLARVLENAGLMLRLQPNLSALVTPEFNPSYPAGKISTQPGTRIDVTDLADEKKSVVLRGHSPMVQVFGRPRVRRRTAAMIPVFHSEDRRVWRLSDIGKVWPGVTLAYINQQTPMGSEKSFADMPPRGTDPTPPLDTMQGFLIETHSTEALRALLHVERQRIMRAEAYRLYAPAELFDDKKPDPKLGVPFLTDEDFEIAPFLPVMEVPIYTRELRGRHRAQAVDKESIKADLGEMKLIPPIVHARRQGQGLFSFAEGTPEFRQVERRFKELIASAAADVKRLDALIQTERETAVKWLETLQKAEQQIAGLNHARVGDIEINGDVRAIGEELGVTFRTGLIRNNEESGLAQYHVAAAFRRKAQYEKWKKELSGSDSVFAKMRDNFEKFKAVYSEQLAVKMKMNLPHQACPPGFAQVDPKTGLVLFSEPVYWDEQPFLVESDNGFVGADGAVTLTYGYELKANTIEDLTSVMFARRGDNIACVGFSRPSPIKALVERDATLRLYESDSGTPMNMTDVVEAARRKAAAHLSAPIQAEGFTYELHGFRKAVLDWGVMQVRHEFDGDVGMTFVGVNSWTGALGPRGADPKNLGVNTVAIAAASQVYDGGTP